MSDHNKAIVRKIVEEHWNRKKTDMAGDLFAATCVIHTPDGGLTGVDGAKQLLSAYGSAFPDFQMTVDELIAEGDQVALRYSFSGTNAGPFGAAPATGKRVTTHGMTIVRIGNGKVTEARMEWDRVSLRQQIGLLPAD